MFSNLGNGSRLLAHEFGHMLARLLLDRLDA
jgi:hypothetical protein